jgi:GNAT superfamily N-acetyltransferase
VAYVDGDPAGYVLYAPPSYLPGAHVFPTAPASEDAVLLATATVFPEYAGTGLGRVLMQAVVKDLVKRGGIRALEAFGDARAPADASADTSAVTWEHGYGHCVLPADFLLAVGFRTQRPHPRYPRMRMELRAAVTWRDEVEQALEKLMGAVRPHRPTPEPAPRVRPAPRHGAVRNRLPSAGPALPPGAR